MPRRVETDLAPNVVGELIASEVEVRTGRCENFGEAAAAMEERRARSTGSRASCRLALGGTGTHPWSRWQDQRIIDTPHYRRNDEILRYVVWRNNTFGLHVHVGIAGADRAIAVHDALRNFLPEVLALSASSPFVEARQLGPALGAHRGVHAHVPALRHPGRLRRLARAGRTTSRSSTAPARSPSTRRSGGASARTSPIRRSRSGSPTASRISPRRSRSRPSVTAWPSAAPARSTRASRCRTCRTACSRRTCGGRSATASRASCSTSSAASRCTRARGSSSCSSGSRPSRARSARRRS